MKIFTHVLSFFFTFFISGFVSGRSCIGYVFTVRQIIEQMAGGYQAVIVNIVDLSAFTGQRHYCLSWSRIPCSRVVSVRNLIISYSESDSL